MVIESIPQVSAIFIMGLITSLIAYYIGLCNRVKEFMDKKKEEYTDEFSEYSVKKFENLGFAQQVQPKDFLNLMKKFWKDAQLHTLELQEKILFEAYDVKRSLVTMRNAFFGAIIFFVIAIVLSYSVYSSYAILSFVTAILLVAYGFSLFIGISRIFLD